MANIEPLILIARSLSRIPSAGGRLPVRHALVLGELAGMLNGPRTTTLSASDAPSGTSAWIRFGKPSSTSRSAAATPSCSVAERPLLVAEAAALGLLGLRRRGVAGPAQLPDVLRQLVDPRPDRVAAGRDLAQVVVERGGLGELLEQGGIAAPGGGGAHGVGIAAQQADVDHESVTLPADRSAAAGGSPGGGTRANSFSTSA